MLYIIVIDKRIVIGYTLQSFSFSLAGVKIIGGYRELTGEEFGIFIKRVLPGGLASQDGMLILLIHYTQVFCEMTAVNVKYRT